MIYLASPYSHPDPTIRDARFRAACIATAALIRDGEAVFSPVVHCHPLVQYGLPGDWEFWRQFDSVVLARCDELVVLELDGWDSSAGVEEEIALARDAGLPVRHLAADFAAGSPTLARVPQTGGSQTDGP
jgi:hypothetical protein